MTIIYNRRRDLSQRSRHVAQARRGLEGPPQGGLSSLGACPDSVRCYGDLEGVGGFGPGFGWLGRVGGVQAVASFAADGLRPWASLSMLWARQTRPHSWATLS